ncbi:MAG: substrate-binding domain-containing protein [Gammaproteobacteria bacterium]|nr:substrate-binding domain-containing protein [Gammaproteobacteria bacterium]
MFKFLKSLFLLTFLLLNSYANADEHFITIASTTSTDNSGLFEVLLPAFTKETGIDVRVVAVGTGQAIKLARNGDADILFVHHKPSEEKFISDGFGVQRYDVMYNDFVIVGPGNDPVGIRGLSDVTAALGVIADSKQPFASRGDDSGTHKKERSLWKAAGVDLNGDWYRETGSGMGATLNVASGINAYALTDRATWLKFKNKGELEILTEGDERLFNQYGIILVNREKHAHVKSGDGQRFIDWLVSDNGQSIIDAYTIEGQQAFFANAEK